MANPTHGGNLGRTPWRQLITGGFIGAVGGLFVLIARKLFLVRAPTTAEQSVLATPEVYQPGNPKTAFEPTDWELAPVGLIYVGIPVLLVISCFVLIAAYPTALSDVSRTLRINPPGPRLQTDPEGDLRRFRAEEDKRLNGYYWIDKQKGVAHIPIEQAMQKVARDGIAGFPKAQQ